MTKPKPDDDRRDAALVSAWYAQPGIDADDAVHPMFQAAFELGWGAAKRFIVTAANSERGA